MTCYLESDMTYDLNVKVAHSLPVLHLTAGYTVKVDTVVTLTAHTLSHKITLDWLTHNGQQYDKVCKNTAEVLIQVFA